MAVWLLSITALVAQTGSPVIDAAIVKGEFTQAQRLIRDSIAAGRLDAKTAWECSYNRTYSTAFASISTATRPMCGAYWANIILN